MKKILKKIAEVDAALLIELEQAPDLEMSDLVDEALKKIYFLYVTVHAIDEAKEKRRGFWKWIYKKTLSLRKGLNK